MANAQGRAVSDLLERLNPTEFHHGDCLGADDEAVILARDLGVPRVLGHPPDNDSMRAFVYSDEEFEPQPYLMRNRDIVDSTDVLIAAPYGTSETQRSGTWSTVRYARKLKRPIYIVLPRGRVETENIA